MYFKWNQVWWVRTVEVITTKLSQMTHFQRTLDYRLYSIIFVIVSGGKKNYFVKEFTPWVNMTWLFWITKDFTAKWGYKY